MKIAGYLFLFLLVSYTSTAQEIPVITPASSEFIVKRLEITPSLTNLGPEIPNIGKFRIREVNFDLSGQPREINLTEMMDMEAQMKTRYVELDPPLGVPEQKKSFYIGRTPNPGETPLFYNQSFSPELPGRGTRNSVYRDARVTTGAQYLETFSPFLRRYGTGYDRFYY